MRSVWNLALLEWRINKIYTNGVCLAVTQYSVLRHSPFLVSALVKGDLEIRRTCGFNWRHSCHVRDDVNQIRHMPAMWDLT
jgi:hypothetical protein